MQNAPPHWRIVNPERRRQAVAKVRDAARNWRLEARRAAKMRKKRITAVDNAMTAT